MAWHGSDAVLYLVILLGLILIVGSRERDGWMGVDSRTCTLSKTIRTSSRSLSGGSPRQSYGAVV